MAAGEVSWVGERGRELFVPSTSGVIIPHERSETIAASAAAGGDTNISVNLLDKMEARSVRDIADGLRMVERRGYLARAR